jgi:triosephosphate isomerase (TIM)
MNSIVVANWKMNPPTFAEAKKLLETTRRAGEEARGVSVIVAPPSLFLRDLRASYKGRSLSFAAQNAHAEKSGSYTGEISMAQVKDARATHVIIGHAERRAMGETNDDVHKKIVSALDAGMIPILCVGETTRGSDGDFYPYVRQQLTSALCDVPSAKVSRIIIAYEPVWAIGADKPMRPRDMQEMAIFIRKTIVEIHGQSSMKIKILYGGSVDETNAGEMILGSDVHGLLVGRASTDHRRLPALLDALASL